MNQTGSPKKSFRSFRKTTEWIVSLSIVWLIIYLIPFIILFFSFVTLSKFMLCVMYLYFFDSLHLAALIVWFAVFIISLYWFYKATDNTHILGAKGIFSPSMAVIWWFIPILNLWKPYQLVQQIWKASNPLTVLSNGTEWINSAGSNMVKLWWILTVSFAFTRVVDALIPESARLELNSTYLPILVSIIITSVIILSSDRLQVRLKDRLLVGFLKLPCHQFESSYQKRKRLN
jgi:hypothetical protein